MKVISFYNKSSSCEFYIVLKYIRCISLRPVTFDSNTNNPSEWLISVDAGNYVHTCQLDNYDDAFSKFKEILDAINDK